MDWTSYIRKLQQILTKPATMPHAAPFLSMSMSFYPQPTDQEVHYPTSSTPPTTKFRKLSYTSNTIGNNLSLPDKLELLDSVRSRRSSIESIISQTTPLGSPAGSPRSNSRNSFSLQTGSQESLSSLVSIDEGTLGQSKDGFATEAIDGVHSAKRRTVKPISTPISVTIAVVALEREESSVMVTKDNHTDNGGNASLIESQIRTNTTANPFDDSSTSKSHVNDNASQDSLTQYLEKKSSLNKPRRARLSLDSSPSSGRVAPYQVVPDPSPSTLAPVGSSYTTSSPATVKLSELDAEVIIRSSPIPNP